MGKKDNKIDDYIAKSQDFAKPILKHIRELVHNACPDVEEKMKWSFLHFDYKDEMMCSMAAFKQHCAFNFWKASIMKDPNKILSTTERESMGNFGRIMKLKDLPSDKIISNYIKEAVRLNDENIKLPQTAISKKKAELKVPDYFKKVLNKNSKAQKVFREFSYSHKKEYLDWIIEAKTEETKNTRMKTAIEWISKGKDRNWKYRK